MDILFKIRDNTIYFCIEFSGHVRGTGNNQGRSRLVDQDAVNLVHYCVIKIALTKILLVKLHVVAQIIKSKLVVGAVCNVGVIGIPALFIAHIVQDLTNGEAKRMINSAHPLCITLCQVIIHRDQVYAPSGQCIKIKRHGGDKGFSFAGLHLGNGAVVQHDAADELNIIGPFAQNASCSFPGNGKGLKKQISQGLSLGNPLLEFNGLSGNCRIIELLNLRLQ